MRLLAVPSRAKPVYLINLLSIAKQKMQISQKLSIIFLTILNR